MRSLQGLGDQPRLLAANVRDRRRVKELSDAARQSLLATQQDLAVIWPVLSEWWTKLTGNASNPERAEFASLQAAFGAVIDAVGFISDNLKIAPSPLGERVTLLGRLMEAQGLRRVLHDGDNLGRTAFGSAWIGHESNWSKLTEALEWIDKNQDVRELAAATAYRPDLADRAAKLLVDGNSIAEMLGNLFDDLRLNRLMVFGVENCSEISLADLSAKLELWKAKKESLSKWVAWRGCYTTAQSLGLTDLVDRLADGRLSSDEGRSVFEMAYYEALLAQMAAADPEIARFDGELHNRRIQNFRDLDLERIATARLEVVAAHHRRIPQGGAAGPLGILRAEIARRRGHMPIRQLMQKAGPAIKAIKPVFMMSPLSVAQFLPPGILEFDLLVMDEASQIQPVDALGAIARAKQVVVVGDERQLPPTRFFSKMTSGDGAGDEDEEDAAQVADIESILGLFKAKGLPQRMLRWHYRSRHQSLIAVSNSQFYENRLFIVPSPFTQEAGMGLQFHHLPEGVFDSGGSGTNVVEAKAVAAAVLEHALEYPGHSLGVATFSAAQRKAILDELERLRRLNPDVEAFFHAHPNEPFFVKNLENVQGDERDVIFISVGYGRNAQGYMAMRFGPLSADGGERRLNVLISRAKRRCEVFASITDEDIDTERGKGKGVQAFKLFLHFARTGRLTLGEVSGRGHDSPFEEQVGAALRAKGYIVRPQVGLAGFFIDLAVVDPDRPGRYVLGIECDGDSYHSSLSARDRDRLRQAVLEDQGWFIHRIWSIDWFQRPQMELKRLETAIEASKAEIKTGSRNSGYTGKKIISVERERIIETERSGFGSGGQSVLAYVEASFAVPSHAYELHETPIGLLAEIVVGVVAVEAPIHLEEIVSRIRGMWGLQRSGNRIQMVAEQALQVACSRGQIVQDGAFFSTPATTVNVRDRSTVTSPSLRKPDMLPPTEISKAVMTVVESNFGAKRDEILYAVSRAFGFKATSSQLKSVIENVIQALVLSDNLMEQDHIFVVGSRPKASSSQLN